MTENSFFWAGNVTGDAQNLTNDEFTDVFRQLCQLDRDFMLPVLHSYFSPHVDLNITITNTDIGGYISVENGFALVDGKLYHLTETLRFEARRTGYYRLVLRKEFPALRSDGVGTGQTVKLAMLYSDTSNDGEPFPTRSDGVVWEVTLAMFYCSDANVLDFYPDSGSYGAYSIGGEYGLRNFPRYSLNILKRQGGSATDWSVSGTSNYPVPMGRVEVGSFSVSSNPQAFTFCQAFSYPPIVIIVPFAEGTAWSGNNICVSAVSASGFSVRADSIANLDFVHYLAIGPN